MPTNYPMSFRLRSEAEILKGAARQPLDDGIGPVMTVTGVRYEKAEPGADRRKPTSSDGDKN
jgi:hypothetical protein